MLVVVARCYMINLLQSPALMYWGRIHYNDNDDEIYGGMQRAELPPAQLLPVRAQLFLYILQDLFFSSHDLEPNFVVVLGELLLVLEVVLPLFQVVLMWESDAWVA